jgi:LCP family protein required for cell wall assembly
MPGAEKPYRVYRGGRTIGRVPLRRRPRPASDGRAADGRPRIDRPKPPRKRLTWPQRIALVVGTLLLLFVIWAGLSYLSFSRGVHAANKRLDADVKSQLARQDGLLLAHPTTILLLGTDHANTDARVTAQRSDSIMLVRTDPSKHRIAYLSIPRDLKVEIPGHGEGKINAAFQYGGTPLAIETIRHFTGLPINHVAILDFDSFEELIDELGGIDVYVPEPILSNRFDCPYKPARCRTWRGWSFQKGTHHMNGRRALIYSRIRENQLNPSESDVTRGERQQRVLQALESKLTSPGTMLKMPFVGDDVLKPLTTDLSAAQFTELAWVKFRAPGGRALHCRLGGSASTIGGQSYIVSTQENISVINMFTGRSAPQPPPPGSGPFGPGCVVGSRALS